MVQTQVGDRMVQTQVGDRMVQTQVCVEDGTDTDMSIGWYRHRYEIGWYRHR